MSKSLVLLFACKFNQFLFIISIALLSLTSSDLFSTESPPARRYPESSVSNSSFHVSEGKQSIGYDSKKKAIVMPSLQEREAAHDQRCDLSGRTSNS